VREGKEKSRESSLTNDRDQTAVLVASPAVRQFLINYARPFIFSTAMSVNNVLAIESAWDVLESDEGDQVRLHCENDLYQSRATMNLFAFI
jgi:7-keto-8-aminopelargonate synthetase-like enzyme